MTPSRTEACPLPSPRVLGVLMLGAALALVPMTGRAQTTQPADTAGQSGPMENASPAATQAAGAAPAAGQGRQAAGTLRTAEGAEIGNVVITETASGVTHVILDIQEGAVPAAQHALHIHENGPCEGPTFQSAGGHLAGGKDHGVHSANGAHTGDLPNITMGAPGALHTEAFMPAMIMDQILDGNGSALVIHAGVDDYVSQPAGNAGDRIACAVLQPSS